MGPTTKIALATLLGAAAAWPPLTQAELVPMAPRPVTLAELEAQLTPMATTSPTTPTEVALVPMAPRTAPVQTALSPMHTRPAAVQVALQPMQTAPAATQVALAPMAPRSAEQPMQLARLAEMSPAARLASNAARATSSIASTGGTGGGAGAGISPDTTTLAGTSGISASIPLGPVAAADSIPPLPAFERPDLPGELVLDVKIGRESLGDGLIAYQAESADGRPGALWVPVHELARVLGLGLRVDAARGAITGWVNGEADTITLDLNRQTLTRRGQSVPFPAGQITSLGPELYVASTALPGLLGLSADLNLSRLELVVASAQPLPIQVAQARAERWASLDPERALRELYARAVRLPYSRLGVPVASLSFQQSYGSTTGFGGQNVSVQAQGDVLYGTGNFSFGLTKPKDGGWDLSLGSFNITRDEPSPTLFRDYLGRFAASRVAVGDVGGAVVDQAGLPTNGRGVRLSNADKGLITNPEQFVLEGIAPQGWDVEVYQNANLVAFQKVGADGRYAFNTLPLAGGLNSFRVVQYGPRGERRETTENFTVAAGTLALGQASYDVAVYQPGGRMLGGSSAGLAGQPIMAAGQAKLGLGPNLTATFGAFAPLGTAELASDFGSAGVAAGLAAGVGRLFVQGQAALSSAGSVAYTTTGLLSLPGQINLRAGYQRTTPSGTTLEDVRAAADRLQLGASFPMPFGERLNLANTITYEQQRPLREAPEHTLSHRLAGHAAGFSFANELVRSWQPGSVPITRGNLVSSLPGLTENLQVGLGYQLDAPEPLQTLTLQGGTTLPGRVALNYGLTRNLETGGGWQGTAGLRRTVGPLDVGLTTNATDQGDYGIGLNLATQLVPGDRTLAAVAPGAGINYARASLVAFIDTNGNGTRDAGEPPVPGVRFLNNRTGSQATSNARGVAVMQDLSPEAVHQLVIDMDNLPDVYLQPTREDVVIVGHSGARGKFFFPFTQLGELSGDLVLAAGTSGTLPPFIRLSATRTGPSPTVISTAADPDGYFVLGPMPLGTYQLKLEAPAGWQLATPTTLSLTATQPVQNTLQLRLSNTLPKQHTPPAQE